jgi:hypothetical protein
MATWYFKPTGSNANWSSTGNWWSASNGTGSHPASAPWTTSATQGDNLVFVNGVSTSSVIDTDIGSGLTITGACSVTFTLSNGKTIYGGTYTKNFQVAGGSSGSYGTIAGGTFSSTLAAPYVGNYARITGGTFTYYNDSNINIRLRFFSNITVSGGTFIGVVDVVGDYSTITGGNFSGVTDFRNITSVTITGGTVPSTLSVWWNGVFYINNSATPLDSYGNGTWNSLFYQSATLYSGYVSPHYYLVGVQTTLNSSGNGYWSGTYYVGGGVTTLDSSGNGYWSSHYYLGGAQTTLNSSGTGWWNSKKYISASLFTGVYMTKYYIDGVATSLDSSGNGFVLEKKYIGGVPVGDGWDGTTYNIGGVPTNLDSDGTGIWMNHYCQGGTPFTGWNGTTYYMTGIPTTLNSSGTGFFVNQHYIGGVLG